MFCLSGRAVGDQEAFDSSPSANRNRVMIQHMQKVDEQYSTNPLFIQKAIVSTSPPSWIFFFLFLIYRNQSASMVENIFPTRLQSIAQNLVELCNLGGNAEVDCTVTDFDNESSDDVWVDLCDDLELLALGVFGLGNGGFETGEELLVEFACSDDCNLDLALLCADQLCELVADTFQKAQPVVLSEGVQKVLDSGTLIGSSEVLFKLSNDG